MTDHLEEAKKRMEGADEAAAAKFPVHFALGHALVDIAESLKIMSGRSNPLAEHAVQQVMEQAEGPTEWARTTRERISTKPQEESDG